MKQLAEAAATLLILGLGASAALSQESGSPEGFPEPGGPPSRYEQLLRKLPKEDAKGFSRLIESVPRPEEAFGFAARLMEDLDQLRTLEEDRERLEPGFYRERREAAIGSLVRTLDSLPPKLRERIIDALHGSLTSVGFDPGAESEEDGPLRPPAEVPVTAAPRPGSAVPAPAAPPAERKTPSLPKVQRSFRQGDYAAAEAQAGRVIAAAPHQLQAYALRAMALAMLGRPDEADSEIATALRIAPKDSNLLAARAFVLNRTPLPQKAHPLAEEAIELSPSNDWAWYQLAYAQAGLADRSGSLRSLSQAATLAPREFGDLRRAASRTEGNEELLAFFRAQPGAAQSPFVGRPPPLRRLLLLLILAGIFLGMPALLFLKRRRIATWIVRQGMGAAAATPPADEPPAPAGVRIPTGYRIRRQIGSGGMGAVFEAEDLSLERRVAIKRMRDEIRLNPAESERFLKEARTVAKLHHPNIIEIHAVVEKDGDILLVFEYIDGMTLDAVLAKNQRLALPQARFVLRQAGAALHYAHAQGVIHRDLKPSNIMITKDTLVKVMDFGVARVAKDALSRLSMTNTMAGTPPYMAPESEAGVVRRESDIYSLGVCLYEMITGALPFEGSFSGMLEAKRAMRFTPPSRRVPGLPAPLDPFFAAALHEDPDRRPPTAAEFTAAFETAARQ